MYIEKIQVQLTDGTEVYVDTEKQAKTVAKNHLEQFKKLHGDKILWDESCESAILVNPENFPYGYEVYITPMLIREEEWKKMDK